MSASRGNVTMIGNHGNAATSVKHGAVTTIGSCGAATTIGNCGNATTIGSRRSHVSGSAIAMQERRQEKVSEFERESARTRGALNQVHSRLDKLSQQLERLARSEAAARQLAPQRRAASLGEAHNDANGRLTGAPAAPRRPIERPAAPAPVRNRPATNADSVSIDDAVAEIAARQRALDGEPAPQPAVREVPADRRQPCHTGERVLDSEPETRPRSRPSAKCPPRSVIDIDGLERQLRQITARIESLGPSSDLESSVAAIRGDLTDIARLITEALPRRAVESLEIEVKALAQRIEHSRQCGVDMGAIAGLERGLGDVREALQNLKPAESLVGFDEAVRALSQKVDMIVAKDDPAALQQLETAIGALRGIVSHVASNETLTKVAEDVRSLAAKVDTLASTAASGQHLRAGESHRDADQRADRFDRSGNRGAARAREAAHRADREARMGAADPHRSRRAWRIWKTASRHWCSASMPPTRGSAISKRSSAASPISWCISKSFAARTARPCPSACPSPKSR